MTDAKFPVPQTHLISEADCLEKLKLRPRQAGPWLTYSNLLGGWTDSPLGSLVSLDDHGFHRGDGIFEALRVVHGKVYLFESHFQRLQLSADRIGLTLPTDFEHLKRIIEAGLHLWKSEEALLRIFVTRGPGSFSTNPHESLGSQLFVVLMPMKPLNEEKFLAGVKVGRSHINVKDPWMAITKSLNYLPNVMMKKEALERGLDFTVSFDHEGGLAESSTENMIVITQDGFLAHPKLARVLRGCTMQRLFDLVEARKWLPVRREVHLSQNELLSAQGLMMVGTTLDVISVIEFEGQPIPKSPWAAKMRDLIQQDQKNGA